MYNLLFTNAGRRATLLCDMKESFQNQGKIVATDNWAVAPALFKADRYYITPKINADGYFEELNRIIRTEEINMVTTLIDPEISILSKNRDELIKQDVLPLCPSSATAELCFDKYKMFLYLKENKINTVDTYDGLQSFVKAYRNHEIKFPVFIKPRTGSGSVGAQRIDNMETLKDVISNSPYNYIIQEYMDGEDCDADVYVDAISHVAVACFCKKKIETRIGGASKTISFKDKELFLLIEEIVSKFEFSGPIDMDFFYKNGKYYLSEINPRFGGAYLHAYGAGVDFGKLIAKNIDGKCNEKILGNYKEDSIMLMYDAVVITNKNELKGDYRD